MTQIGILANQFNAFSSKLRQPIKLKQISLGGKNWISNLSWSVEKERATSICESGAIG